MGATATRTGVGAPARGLDWPRAGLAALAALATAWTLSLLVAGAVLVVSGQRRLDLGDAPALPLLGGFAAAYCAALAVLVRPYGGLQPLAAAAVAVVVVLVGLPGPNVAAAAAGLIAVAAIVVWGVEPPGIALDPALVLGAAGAAVLAVSLAAIASSPAAASRPLARATARADVPPAAAPAAAVPARRPAAESPVSIVRAYYRALDQRDFAAAWGRLSPAVRTAFGGYAAWRAGYATTLSSRPSDIEVVGGGPDTVLLRHALHAVDRAAGGPRRSRFVVDWRLTRTAGGWIATSLTARTG